MKYFLIFTLFLSSSFASDTCRIDTYDQIIKINKVIDDSVIKSTTCSAQINEDFISLINNANGKLNSNYLNSYFKSLSKANVIFTPQIISVQSLREIITSQYAEDGLIVDKVSTLMGRSTLSLKRGEAINLECNNCNAVGNKNIKLNVRGKVHWVSAQFYKQQKAFKLNKSLNSMTPIITRSDFKEVQAIQKNGVKYFQDIGNIQFYKLNKHLSAGDIIKVNDVYPKTLITYGQRVKLTITNNLIKLKSIGVARKSGKIGDFIEIQNPKSKKVFLGKITNYNEAFVEL